jgi:hypothetical protein
MSRLNSHYEHVRCRLAVLMLSYRVEGTALHALVRPVFLLWRLASKVSLRAAFFAQVSHANVLFSGHSSVLAQTSCGLCAQDYCDASRSRGRASLKTNSWLLDLIYHYCFSLAESLGGAGQVQFFPRKSGERATGAADQHRNIWRRGNVDISRCKMCRQCRPHRSCQCRHCCEFTFDQTSYWPCGKQSVCDYRCCRCQTSSRVHAPFNLHFKHFFRYGRFSMDCSKYYKVSSSRQQQRCTFVEQGGP